MTKEEEKYHAAAETVEGSVKSQMFGKPCYKINGKAFCAFFEDAMVFKLTQPVFLQAIQLEDSKLFDPSGKGRAMKEWVQVTFHHQSKWELFASAAKDYVSTK